jgi:hypothetical protein
MAMTEAGKNRIMIFGPKADGTYVYRVQDGRGRGAGDLNPQTETTVVRHFQERMPYGLFVPDIP